MNRRFLILFINLRHLVECYCELALLVSGSILVNDVALNSLVNNNNCGCISSLSCSLVTAFNCCIELLDSSLHLALEHLVAKSFNSSNFYTLLCTFNIRHFRSSNEIKKNKTSKYQSVRRCLRGCFGVQSHTFMEYNTYKNKLQAFF